MAAFRAAGATLHIPERIALTGEDRRTWRPDRAPQAVKDAIEARRKAEADKRKAEAQSDYEIPYGQVMFRPSGSAEPFRVLGNVAVEGAPPPEARNAGADLMDAMRQGIITHYARDELGGGAVTVRPPGRVDEILTPNGDGTHTLRVGNYTFPRVVPTGDVGVGNTVTFRIAPERQERPVRVMRSLNGGVVRVPSLWDEATPARDRADIEADINRIEEALMGGNVPAASAMTRLQGLHRELAMVDRRPLPEGTPRFVRMAPMSFQAAQAAQEMLQEPGGETAGEAA